MESKDPATPAPDVAGITAGRAAQILGLGHTDSVRRLYRDGHLRRNADDLYTLESVLALKARRDSVQPGVTVPA